jgi:hypothetical protein
LIFGEDVLFDADSHTYRDRAGTEYRSVTTFLKAEGLIDDRFYKPSGTTRGTLVHEATAQIDFGNARPESYELMPWFPYVMAWVSWKETSGFKPEIVEEVFINDELSYAGTVDRIGTLAGRDTWVIDLKSGKPENWHGLQLGAYTLPFRAAGMDITRIGAVYLDKKGRGRLIEYNYDLCLDIVHQAFSWDKFKRLEVNLRK